MDDAARKNARRALQTGSDEDLAAVIVDRIRHEGNQEYIQRVAEAAAIDYKPARIALPNWAVIADPEMSPRAEDTFNLLSRVERRYLKSWIAGRQTNPMRASFIAENSLAIVYSNWFGFLQDLVTRGVLSNKGYMVELDEFDQKLKEILVWGI